MTRQETIKVLAVLKAAYPASYRNMTKDEANGVVTVWAAQFADMPVQAVMIAVQKLISSCTFPPTINEVKSKLRGVYWEAWQELNADKLGYGEMSERQRKDTRAIMQACERYNRAASNEPTLAELIGGVQNYITSGAEALPE